MSKCFETELSKRTEQLRLRTFSCHCSASGLATFQRFREIIKRTEEIQEMNDSNMKGRLACDIIKESILERNFLEIFERRTKQVNCSALVADLVKPTICVAIGRLRAEERIGTSQKKC